MLPAPRHSERGANLRSAVGVGMGVAISLAASVALVLGHTLFTAPGYGADPTSWAVFFGLVAACVIATPFALRLGKVPKGHAGRGTRAGGPEPHRSVSAGKPMPNPDTARLNEKRAERELLEAIRRHGRVTSVEAALETSLTVAEADRMLSELARDGHLEVLVEGRKLFYGL